MAIVLIALVMIHEQATRSYAAAYVIGEMIGAERNDLESHMFDCPDCSSRVEEGEGFLGTLRSLMREGIGDRGNLCGR